MTWKSTLFFIHKQWRMNTNTGCQLDKMRPSFNYFSLWLNSVCLFIEQKWCNKKCCDRLVSSQCAIRRLWLALYNTARVAVQSRFVCARLSAAAIHIASACCCTPASPSPRPCGSHLQKSCAASFIHPVVVVAKKQHSIKKSALE